MLKNNLFLDALEGRDTERAPVWLMRQAGRTLKEYRELRAQAGSFIRLVKTPQYAAEATVQPVDILGVDAAILFSDILVIPEAMGLPYEMEETKGPFFPKTVCSEHDIHQLKIASGDEYGYVMEAICHTLKKLDGRVPLIGFCGAPWTLFAYMVEGKGSKTFSKAKKMLFSEPGASEKLLEKITMSCISYLKDQVKAGVHAVQIFDSWAGVLGPYHYQKFVVPYLKTMVDELKTLVPVILFCKDAHHSLEALAALGPHALGLDWTIDPVLARTVAGERITLQGNLDPCILYAGEEVIKEETERMLRRFGKKRYICNLGHGVYPDVEAEKIKFFIKTVKNFNF
ncbi:MAG: uroporphyrinogen decarboxylase [Bacteroidia bacterium]|nr:uroporphyrinogen decarboxylase [Bacteroidia bacterium]